MHGVKPNGKLYTTAIDPTSFYVHKMTGGSIFRASLSASLRDLGFEIERDGMFFRIKGISEELCERTSQRRAEIKEALLQRCGNLARLQGLSEQDILKSTSGRMAELINLETRKAKKELSRADIFEGTRQIAREMRIPEHHVEDLLV
ncbi:MAG: relaxase domain-containing protein, partial [Singulisphaera sp.]